MTSSKDKKLASASFFTFLYVHLKGGGGLEAIPAVIRREAGYTLDRSPIHHRATQRQTRQTTTHTLTPKDNFRDTNMHVFERWEEAGVPGENPRIHGENMHLHNISHGNGSESTQQSTVAHENIPVNLSSG